MHLYVTIFSLLLQKKIAIFVRAHLFQDIRQVQLIGFKTPRNWQNIKNKINAKIYLKIHSLPLYPVIWEKQTKTTLRLHYTPLKMAKVNKTNNKCWEHIGKWESTFTVRGTGSWYGRYGNYYEEVSIS